LSEEQEPVDERNRGFGFEQAALDEAGEDLDGLLVVEVAHRPLGYLILVADGLHNFVGGLVVDRATDPA